MSANPITIPRFQGMPAVEVAYDAPVFSVVAPVYNEREALGSSGRRRAASGRIALALSSSLTCGGVRT